MSMNRIIIVCLLLCSCPAIGMAQQTGGGNTGGGGTVNQANGSNIEQPTLQLNRQTYQFEDIRNEYRFIGVSSDTVVHPYSRVRNNLQTDIQSIGTTGDSANQAGSRGAGNTSQFGGFNSPFEQFIAGQFNGGQTSGQTTPIRSILRYQPTILMGTAAARPTFAVRSSQMTAKIRSIPGLSTQSYTVEIRNKIAFVRGTVESEDRKKQIGRLLRFEPGVSRIVNELKVSR